VLLLLPRARRRSEPGAAGVILALGGSSRCRLALIAGVASCRLGRLGSTRSRLLGAAPALNSRKEAGVAADLRRVLPTDCVSGEYCSSRDMAWPLLGALSSNTYQIRLEGHHDDQIEPDSVR
jgi:hypothetical protein